MSSGTPWLHYNIHDAARIRTNVPRLEIPEYFRVESIVPDFELRIVDRLDLVGGDGAVRKIGFGVYDYGDGVVVHEADLPFLSLIGSNARVRSLVSGLGDTRTRIDVAVPFFGFNPILLKVTQMLFKMARVILAIKLLRNGCAPVYAGSAASGDLAVLLFGYSWTGKSMLLSTLLNAGWAYLSDDYTILDTTGGAHCYPDWHAPRATHGDVPFLRYLRRRPLDLRTPRNDCVPVRPHAKVHSVLLLERGPDSVEEIDAEEAARRIMLINLEEIWKFWSSPLTQIVAYYSYLYPEFDLEALTARYWSLVTSALDRAERHLVVRTRSPGFELARDVIDRIAVVAGR